VQLAQLNIADAQHPVDSEAMIGFTGRVDAINALADRAPGFVWRMTDDGPEDGALSLRMEGLGPETLVNMSVWESVEALYHFIYQTAHAKVMRGKDDWFNAMPVAHMVLWWVEDDHIPDLNEAREKLDLLRTKGPTPDAFSFALPFDINGSPVTPQMGRKDCA
jgi:hypothetical protein